MHFSLSTLTLLLTTLLPLAAAKHHCTNDYVLVYRVYNVDSTTRVPNPGAVCDKLWANLRSHSGCQAPSSPKCYADGNGILQWDFIVPITCEAWHVESAWWESTEGNKFGSIDCR